MAPRARRRPSARLPALPRALPPRTSSLAPPQGRSSGTPAVERGRGRLSETRAGQGAPLRALAVHLSRHQAHLSPGKLPPHQVHQGGRRGAVHRRRKLRHRLGHPIGAQGGQGTRQRHRLLSRRHRPAEGGRPEAHRWRQGGPHQGFTRHIQLLKVGREQARGRGGCMAVQAVHSRRTREGGRKEEQEEGWGWAI